MFRAGAEACLADPRTGERLQGEIREGTAAGITGTPTVLLNGKRLRRLDDFVPLVDCELDRLGVAPLPQPSGSRG